MSSDHYSHHSSSGYLALNSLLPLPNDYQDFNQVVLFIISLCLIEFIVTAAVIYILPTGVEDKLYLNSCIITIPKVAIMLYYITLVVQKSFGGDTLEIVYNEKNGQQMDYGNIGIFFCLYISHSLMATFTELWKDGFGKGTFTMILHHGISIGAYSLSMYTRRFGFSCCFAALCEVTNFPLCILYITKTKGGGVKEWMEKTFGILLSVNGGILWITFVIFRMILFPYINYKFIALCLDLKTNYPERWSNVWWFEIIFHLTTVTLLFVMSSYWFYKIHIGIVKILKGMKASDAAPEKAE